MILLLLLAICYLMALRGRTGHPGLSSLKGHRYAHRGLHGADAPENSLLAFQRAIEKGYGFELDVHLMQDGNLAVIHDSSLLRTTGADISIEELSLPQLSNYRLQGTQETIPTLPQILALCQGAVPMIIELKSVGNNYAQLCEATMAALACYPGIYCIESFDPRCISYLKKHYPKVIRGQLSADFIKENAAHLNRFSQFAMTYLLSNFLTKPDFVAYHFPDHRQLSFRLCQKLWKVQAVAWTLRNAQALEEAENAGMIPIFENFTP